MKQKSAVVIGAGVVGVVTAEALWNDGYQVTVIEKNNGPALATSAGNAGQLCGPFCLPFSGPGFLPMFMKKSISGMGVGANFLDMIRHLPWAFKFMRNCSLAAYRTNAEAMLRLAHESVAALDAVLARHPVEFNYKPNCGKLYLYDSPSALTAETQLIDLRRDIGYDVHVLSKSECQGVEPALKHSNVDFAGGIYATNSSLGDCALFTLNLTRALQEKGVAFHYGVTAQKVIRRQGRTQGISLGDSTIDADVVVLTSAVGTRKILPSELHSRYPIAPLKGYSVTLPLLGDAPAGSVTDAKRAVAVSVLGNAVRITGGAYLSSSMDVPHRHIKRIVDVAKEWFPHATNYDVSAHSGWAGLRPASPNSVPYIGSTKVPGLFINTGHGGFGWTCAAGSARRLLAAISRYAASR